MEVFVQFPSSHRPTLRFSFADRRHGPIGGLLSTVQVPALRCRPGAALLPPQQILGLRGGEGLARWWKRSRRVVWGVDRKSF